MEERYVERKITIDGEEIPVYLSTIEIADAPELWASVQPGRWHSHDLFSFPEPSRDSWRHREGEAVLSAPYREGKPPKWNEWDIDLYGWDLLSGGGGNSTEIRFKKGAANKVRRAVSSLLKSEKGLAETARNAELDYLEAQQVKEIEIAERRLQEKKRALEATRNRR